MKEKLFIGIGAEVGTRSAPDVISNFQIALNRRSFAEGCDRHFRSLHGLHVAMRLSGETKTFSEEIASKPRKMRGKPYLTIEWVIPETAWRGANDSQLKEMLGDGLTFRFQKLIEHARRDDELVNEAHSYEMFTALLTQTLDGL